MTANLRPVGPQLIIWPVDGSLGINQSFSIKADPNGLPGLFKPIRFLAIAEAAPRLTDPRCTGTFLSNFSSYFIIKGWALHAPFFSDAPGLETGAQTLVRRIFPSVSKPRSLIGGISRNGRACALHGRPTRSTARESTPCPQQGACALLRNDKSRAALLRADPTT